MKIVHLMLSCFYIDHYSYQENLLPKYHKLQGHDVEIIASLVSFDQNGKSILLPTASRYTNEFGIPVTRLDYAKRPFSKSLRKYIGLSEALERVSPDLIFIHGVQFSDISVVAAYLKRHPDVKAFADNHADYSNSATNWLSKRILHEIIWRRCARLIEPYVTRFYGVLPARVDFLIREYKLSPEKIALLEMGADDERVAQAAAPEIRNGIRNKLGLEKDDFVIMTGGKIDAFKTQTLLLMEAVRQIRSEKVRLVVFGSVTPELKEKVEKLADGEKCRYIGWILANDSYDYFAAADLVVFPGRHSVFWEQVAAQGIPMICKYWDGTTHVDRGGNVRFLRSDSVDEIKEAVEDCMQPETYARMKQAAEAAGEHFLYSAIARKSIQT